MSDVRLADCARAWLAEGNMTDPVRIVDCASGWTRGSWMTVARHAGYSGEVTADAINEALDELLADAS